MIRAFEQALTGLLGLYIMLWSPIGIASRERDWLGGHVAALCQALVALDCDTCHQSATAPIWRGEPQESPGSRLVVGAFGFLGSRLDSSKVHGQEFFRPLVSPKKRWHDRDLLVYCQFDGGLTVKIFAPASLQKCYV